MTGAVLPCRSYIPSEKCRFISRKDDTKMIRELDSRNLYLFICFPTMRRVLIAWHFLYCAVQLGIAKATSLDVDRIIVITGSLSWAKCSRPLASLQTGWIHCYCTPSIGEFKKRFSQSNRACPRDHNRLKTRALILNDCSWFNYKTIGHMVKNCPILNRQPWSVRLVKQYLWLVHTEGASKFQDQCETEDRFRPFLHPGKPIGNRLVLCSILGQIERHL